MEIFKEEFKFNDYDIIGFDLDNTLARYRIGNMATLEYSIMAKYLVETKSYRNKYLYIPFEDGKDFLIKGLFLDIEKGNILKLDADAKIIKCFHGMQPIDQTQIAEIYGLTSHWNLTDAYVKDPLSCWNGPLTGLVRALLDYFDISVGLIFARLVTTIDEDHANSTYTTSQMWQDICDSLTYMFSYKHFGLNKGEYFPALKKSPELYYYPCSQQVMNWLQELRKQNKLIVLISGSDCDFLRHTAYHTLGDNWSELFDLVVCFAKKPGFFSGELRPFLLRDSLPHDAGESTELSAAELQKGGVYGNGNWEGVLQFASRETGIAKPRALYIGDNMIQDVVTPTLCADIDVIAVVEELDAANHPDKELIDSSVWGPYMGASKPSLWASLLGKYACAAIPHLDTLAQFPIDRVFVKNAEQS